MKSRLQRGQVDIAGTPRAGLGRRERRRGKKVNGRIRGGVRVRFLSSAVLCLPFWTTGKFWFVRVGFNKSNIVLT